MYILEQLKYSAYQPHKLETGRKISAIPKPTNSEHFSMIFPPPNVTGNLHLGHCLTATVQDVIIRSKQQNGFNTQWIFGLDHAGIATQVVVEKILKKELGKSRHEIGRKAFIEEVMKWKSNNSNEIIQDLDKLAASFNWERQYFTMDETHSKAVNEAFIQLFNKGIIYRKSSLINWSCALESAISDIEVENLDIQGTTRLPVPNYDTLITFGTLTEFAYKIVNSNEEIVVATTRPETLLGDVAGTL